MKSATTFGAGIWLAATVLIGTSIEAQQAPAPVEIIACNFINGSDAGDLAGPMSDLNDWMDEHGINDLFVSTVIPVFTSAAVTNDVFFFNRWANGSAMGRSLDLFYGPDGAEATEGFNGVIDCTSSTTFGAILVHAPGENRDGGPMQFLNCTVKENRTVGEGIGAVNRWAEAGEGSSTAEAVGHAVLLPIAGEDPAATYNFKWLILFESFQNYGDALDALFAPGGPALGDIINPVMDCDSARVYNQVVNRRIQND